MYYNPETGERCPLAQLKTAYNASIPSQTEIFGDWHKLHAQDIPIAPYGQRVVSGPIALVDGHYTQPYGLEDIPLTTLKASKLAEINGACDALVRRLTATYPEAETATFYRQESEARAYVLDMSSPTPLLSALSAARGLALDELAARVIAKSDVFATASGAVIGQRQALEDRLDIATTAAEVEAIAVDISLPLVQPAEGVDTTEEML